MYDSNLTKLFYLKTNVFKTSKYQYSIHQSINEFIMQIEKITPNL